MSKYSQVDNTASEKVWQQLNKEFGNIIENDPTPAKAAKPLAELKAKVVSKNGLSIRQTEGLSARIANYMAGTYGKSKTAENFGHEKPTK